MTWNWHQPGWPAFAYDAEAVRLYEQRFQRQSGELAGAVRHVGRDDQETLRIELIGDEAVKTSEIEGEVLDRDSVQSSLRHAFGLGPERAGIRPAERGIASMMVDLYRHFAAPLTDETMCTWHGMLLGGDRSIRVIGGYRTHEDAMQVVSGPIHAPKIHFEAPPSSRMRDEMRRFIAWFNESAPDGPHPLPALTRAALAHLRFVCIHPFEDGNGRIARALAEKALAQDLGRPSLTALSFTIERKRKAYYDALARNNRALEITDWLDYFAATVLEAQTTTIARVDFHLAKARFYARLRDRLNERQAKVIARLFREGIDGFIGGLSAENYIAMTRTSRATATRDLQDLVEKGALERTGALRHTRYVLRLDAPQA